MNKTERLIELRGIIEATCKKLLPNFNVMVNAYEFLDLHNISICIACNTYEINNVGEQYPQKVYLSLIVFEKEKEVLELTAPMRSIYREIDPNNPAEKFLAMKGEKVPFRTPKAGDQRLMLNAIEKFCTNYKNTLRKFEPVLRYKDVCDYEKLLT